jgi:outer membrane protein OmpA-like peptidoglycan-associated protein
MLTRKIVILAMTFLPVVSFAAEYKDPDSPEVNAAARAALAKARILDIQSRVLDIAGTTLGLEAVLKDLAAKVTDREIKIELSADVLFDFDRHSLRPEATETLRKVGRVVTEYTNRPLLIEGYTDGKGAHPYNVTLSENRAAP